MEIKIDSEINTKKDIFLKSLFPAWIIYIVLLMITILETNAGIDTKAPSIGLCFVFVLVCNAYVYLRENKWK